MRKHAYLIIAHNNFELLKKELLLLDHERNDIYIHIDKKAKEVDENVLVEKMSRANVYFINRISVMWGGFSGAQCTINLLKAATSRQEYAYYHLLSGVDLPIKTQDEIHDFFDARQGSEFVSFDCPIPREQDLKRVRRYYLFQEIYGRNRRHPVCMFFFAFDKISVKIQELLKVDRFSKKRGIALQKGANWFSITHELAKLVVEQEKWIQKNFKYTRCCDEVFLQTVLNNSSLKSNLYQNGMTMETNACLRKIDWGRGKPYTWTNKEYDELIQSKCLFARKFDPLVDEEIIDRIVAYVHGK